MGHRRGSLADHFAKAAKENEIKKQNEAMSCEKQESAFGLTGEFESDAAPEQNDVEVGDETEDLTEE
jgi:hypothetical protein